MYIGKSVDITTRYRQHYLKLRNNCHHSKELQNSWNKYGEDYFITGIIEECDLSIIDSREKYYIDLYDSYNNGFNEQLPNGENSGHIFSDEDRVKHSIAIRKSRLKWKQSDWDKNNEYLNKGRINARHKIVRSIFLYDSNTFELKYKSESIEDCAKFLGVNLKTLRGTLAKIKNRDRLTYKGCILIKDNGVDSIEKYLEEIGTRKEDITIKKAISSGVAIINKFTKKYNESIRVRNNSDNRNIKWRENSITAKNKLRESGKNAVDIYLYDTGDYVGRWNLLSDFADEYNLKLMYLQRVRSGYRSNHKNFVVKKVN